MPTQKREKDLVSLASHELRTPVAVIAGALDVLARRATLCDDDARTVARIQRAADGMRADIEALLAVARPASPRYSAEAAVPVDLADNARSVIHELEYGAPTDAGRARLSVVEPVPAVAADPALVRMLLQKPDPKRIAPHARRGGCRGQIGGRDHQRPRARAASPSAGTTGRGPRRARRRAGPIHRAADL